MDRRLALVSIAHRVSPTIFYEQRGDGWMGGWGGGGSMGGLVDGWLGEWVGVSVDVWMWDWVDG